MLKWFRSTSASKWVSAFFNHTVLEMMIFFSLCCLNDAFTYFCLSCFAFLALEELWRQLCCLSAVGVLVDVMCKSRCEQKVLPSKHSGGLPLHVVLAYFFLIQVFWFLVATCLLFGSHLVFCILFLLCLFFFFHGGLSTYTGFFLLVVRFPELRNWSLPVMKLFWMLSI